MLLLTAALAPSAPVEGLIVAVGCGVLALVTDRIRPWPRALAIPAAVAVLLHVADLALGSDLVQRSLLGPNPVLGSRFFGAGNELEIALAAVGLLGLGGALATAPTRTRVWGFAVGGGVLAFAMAWGRLGADVGAVPTVVAGATVAALVAAGNIAWRTRIAILLVAPVAGLAAPRAARPRHRRGRALQPLGARGGRAGRDRGHRGAPRATQLPVARARRDSASSSRSP